MSYPKIEEWVSRRCLYVSQMDDRFLVCLKTPEAEEGNGLVVANVGYMSAAEFTKREFARVIAQGIGEFIAEAVR